MYVLPYSSRLSPPYQASKKEGIVPTPSQGLNAIQLKSSRAVRTEPRSRGVTMEIGSLMLVTIQGFHTTVLLTGMELDFAMEVK
jgi:hypothetical protein